MFTNQKTLTTNAIATMLIFARRVYDVTIFVNSFKKDIHGNANSGPLFLLRIHSGHVSSVQLVATGCARRQLTAAQTTSRMCS